MTYSEALNYTHSLLKFGIKPGLERITQLLSLLGNPHDGLNCVHVAGTNGKGSVCAMLNSVMISAGKRVGMFISPYVVDFRERIQINGQYISQDDFTKTAQTVKDVVEKMSEPPTEFEFITAAAFLYFKENNCDLCIIETGLGGRLDSTNVIKNPLVSVITKISLDHTNVLGDTVEKIAFEKCGIIKEKFNVVTSSAQDERALAVIMQTAAQKNCSVYTPVLNNVTVGYKGIDGSSFVFGDEAYSTNLAGGFQIENALLAIQTAKLLGVGYNIIKEGLAKTHHPARMQIISRQPLIILDGGHNKDGITALKNSLEEFFKGQKLYGVCGMLADKDYEGALKTILPLFDEITALTPENPRALDAKTLCEFIRSQGIRCETAEKNDRLSEHIMRKSQGKPVVIFGSLYLASEVLKLF